MPTNLFGNKHIDLGKIEAKNSVAHVVGSICNADLIVVKNISRPRFLRQKIYAKKSVMCDIFLFATKVGKWFEMLFFHTFLFISTFAQNITQ